MKVYTVSSDPAIGARDIRIYKGQVGILFDNREIKLLYELLNAAKPETDPEAVMLLNLLGQLRLALLRGF